MLTAVLLLIFEAANFLFAHEKCNNPKKSGSLHFFCFKINESTQCLKFCILFYVKSRGYKKETFCAIFKHCTVCTVYNTTKLRIWRSCLLFMHNFQFPKTKRGNSPNRKKGFATWVCKLHSSKIKVPLLFLGDAAARKMTRIHFTLRLLKLLFGAFFTNKDF